jgi:hypothetical protein
MTTNQFERPEGSEAGPTPLGPEHVESLLRGHRPADAPPGADRLADAMHALTGPGAPSELTGYREAMASYGDAFSTTRTGLRPRRLVLVSSVLGIRALAGAAGAALAAGAVGAVVRASTTLGPSHAPQSLPVGTGSTTSSATVTHTADDEADDQGDEQADDQDEQEAAEGSGSSASAVGPDAKGPAAFGLCTAWSHHRTTGTATTETTDTSVAFRNLAKAAGGEAKIAAYCATVPHPGAGKGAGKGIGTTNKAKGKSKDKASTEPKRHGASTTRPGTTPSTRPKAKPTRTTPPGRGLDAPGRPSTTPPVPAPTGHSTS